MLKPNPWSLGWKRSLGTRDPVKTGQQLGLQEKRKGGEPQGTEEAAEEAGARSCSGAREQLCSAAEAAAGGGPLLLWGAVGLWSFVTPRGPMQAFQEDLERSVG